MTERIALVDGVPSPRGLIELSLFGGALHQGVGLFETLRFEGGAIAFAARHTARLCASAKALGFPAPPRVEDWVADLRAASVSGHEAPQRMRWIVFPEEGRLRRALTLEPLARDPIDELVALPKALGYLRPLAAHKTFSWIGAQQALLAVAPKEAVLVDSRGRGIEGARTNLIAVKGHRLIAPGRDAGALPGIAREALLSALESTFAIEDRPIDPAELAECRALYALNALRGLLRIRTAGAFHWQEDTKGERFIEEAFSAQQAKEWHLMEDSGEGSRSKPP